MTGKNSPLALLGGPKSISKDPGDIFTWPIVTKEDEDAVLGVLRDRSMSGTNITKEFEREFADWMGTEYGLGYCNGTAALNAAMWACGVGAGDEVICPSITYWASCTGALSLGAAVNFADIHPDTLCIDPNDIEHRIGPNTRAIMVVHYCGHPADMDPIMEIARRHGVKVIEDVSHAQGGLYKGRKVGTFGDIAAMSLMSGKSFAVGEAGIMLTNNRELYERCIAYGHYERTGAESMYNPTDGQVSMEDLKEYKGIAMGGKKHRMNQMCSAMGRVQLKYYAERIADIQAGMDYFWDQLEGVPGVKAHRPAKDSGSTMAGWYASRGLYRGEELGGLPCAKFCEAVTAEGVGTHPGCNYPLHLHPLFHKADLFHMGKPTMLSFGQRDVRQGAGSLPVAENSREIMYGIPWFKHKDEAIIQEYANAFRKAAEHADELLAHTGDAQSA